MADEPAVAPAPGTALVEPHSLRPVEDHPHWLVIYREQSHCTKGLSTKEKDRTFTRFWARCKRCGKEDRWGVANPTYDLAWMTAERVRQAAARGPDQDEESHAAEVNPNDMRGGARVQMQRQLQATATADSTEEGDDD